MAVSICVHSILRCLKDCIPKVNCILSGIDVGGAGGLGGRSPHEFLWGKSIFLPPPRVCVNFSVVAILSKFETQYPNFFAPPARFLRKTLNLPKNRPKNRVFFNNIAVSSQIVLFRTNEIFSALRTIYRRKFLPRTNFGALTCLLSGITLSSQNVKFSRIFSAKC